MHLLQAEHFSGTAAGFVGQPLAEMTKVLAVAEVSVCLTGIGSLFHNAP